MPEEIILPNTEPVTEPATPNPQEPVTPPVADPQPKADEPVQGGEPNTNIIELLANVDKSVLLKSTVVQTLLESARQQEKNKLYETINKKDTTNKQLENTIGDLEKQLKEKGDKTMEAEKELLGQIQAMKEAQDKLIQDMEAEKEKARLAKLDSYKKSKIAEAKGEIVVGLVRGNSEEEIDSSIELAKQEYQNIVAPLKEQIVQSAKPNPENAPKPSNPSTPPQMEFTAEQIKGMSTAEYAKYRESLLNSVKG